MPFACHSTITAYKPSTYLSKPIASAAPSASFKSPYRKCANTTDPLLTSFVPGALVDRGLRFLTNGAGENKVCLTFGSPTMLPEYSFYL
jgi:hypothetical protein